MKKMLRSLLSYPEGLLHLCFPVCCASCSATLLNGERFICSGCLLSLPLTGFDRRAENPVSRLFWGRTEVETATAFLYFQKKGGVQQLIHKLKYKGRKELGREAGRIFGLELRKQPVIRTCDRIIPVPLHAGRLRKRGYNQSEWIGMGMASVLKIPVDTSTLLRTGKSETQTRKSRFKRWENVEDVFSLSPDHTISGSHILLTDDVVTTGATLEACVNTLKRAGDVRVSIAVLAVAGS
ncbi:MAG: ComF family protein [Bacteroidia bacterium]